MQLIAIRPTAVGETLCQGYLDRPNVPLTPLTGVVLGRNSTTQIADRSISRRACALVYSNNDWHISRIHKNNPVSVNGQTVQPGMQVVLNQGDVIALAPYGMYSYRVDLNDDDDDDPLMNLPIADDDLVPWSILPPARAGYKRKALPLVVPVPQLQMPPPAGPSSAAATSTISQQVLEECSCAICLDLQVQSTCLAPCGHTFCLKCVAHETTCPTCRGAIESRVPCRSLSAVISALSASGVFALDDVQAYQQRSDVDDDDGVEETPFLSKKARWEAQVAADIATGQSVTDAIFID
jgi:hypothetical protein